MMIDAYDQSWWEQLSAAVAALEPGLHLHLLIDTAFVPGLHRALPDGGTRAGRARLLFESLPSCGPAAQDVSPLLLPVDGARMADAGFRRWLSRCDGWPMLHAITTTDTAPALAQRLEQWLVVAADGDRFNFRFPDTRRIAGVYRHLSAVQRAHFVGPATSWRYIGRDGRWTALPGLPLSLAPEALDTRLTAQQFAALVSDSDADSILLILDDRGHPWVQPHSVNHATVQAALAVSGGQCLDELSKVDWCEACLTDVQWLSGDRPEDNFQRWLAQQTE